MHSTPLLILSARRTQPVSTAKPNGDDTVWLSTSVGFRKIKVEDFGYAVERLRPDVVLGLADGPEGFGRGREGGVGRSRVEKMVRRTDDWMGELLGRRAAAGEEKEGDGEEQLGMKGWPAVWAPVLPVETGLQSFYLDRLEDSLDALSGLAFYDAASATTLPAPLDPLVRYSLAAPKTPQDILKHLELGIDLFSIPFIAEATDAGVALQFSFGNPEDPPRDPATSSSTTTATPTAPPTRLPLGVDLWPPTHATSSLPLSPSCPCYACSTHLRAYIHHLLQAKEMLAWVLLQLHNLSVVDRFFAAVRASLRSGGGVGSWERDVRRFEGEYEAEMPVAVGRGPRVRGYQYRNEGMGEERRNEKAFEVYEGGREDEGAGDEVQEADAEGVDEAASIPSTELAEKETP